MKSFFLFLLGGILPVFLLANTPAEDSVLILEHVRSGRIIKISEGAFVQCRLKDQSLLAGTITHIGNQGFELEGMHVQLSQAELIIYRGSAKKPNKKPWSNFWRKTSQIVGGVLAVGGIIAFFVLGITEEFTGLVWLILGPLIYVILGGVLLLFGPKLRKRILKKRKNPSKKEPSAKSKNRYVLHQTYKLRIGSK